MSAPRPTSFRGVFLFSSNGDVSFSQRFSSVEARVPVHRPKMPSDADLTNYFKQKVLSSLASLIQFEFSIDHFISLIVLPTKSYTLACIPLIESKFDPSKPFIEISSSFEFLSFFETASRTILKSVQPDSPPSFFAPLHQLVTQIMPFGAPVVYDAMFATQLISSADNSLYTNGYPLVNPVPTWKTRLTFAIQQIEFKLRESVLGSIDGDKCVYDVFGELRAIAQVSYLPDITVPIANFSSLTQLSSHFCVKKIADSSIVFAPPTGIIQLLLYKAKNDNQIPPVIGTYTVTEENDSINFTLNITKRPPVKRIIVQLPFPGRGALVKHQFNNPPGGQLKINKKEATVMWNMKITEGNTSSLGGNLQFEHQNEGNERHRAYISFKSKKKSFSGVSIDPATITHNSDAKNIAFLSETSYSSESKKYIIWATIAPK